MLRIVARNGRSLSKIRIMPSAIVSNRMVYTGIMPLRHSRIIAAAASSVTAGLQMLALRWISVSCPCCFYECMIIPSGSVFPILQASFPRIALLCQGLAKENTGAQRG